MSLQLAAQHLSNQGRGPDTTLVHMTRGEVKSLNDLAMAHGGSLSINPHTGLPEAGFLQSILPMVAGAALNAFIPGLGMMGAGLLTGAATGLATGSLSKGLMAGLGAYGGAGLMGGLVGAGADVAAQSAYGAGAGATDAAAQAAGFGSAEEMAQIQAANAMQTAKTASPFSTAFEGVKGLGSEAGRNAFMGNIGGGKELLKYGAAAAAPILAMEPTTKQPEIKKDTDPGQQYEYSPDKTAEVSNDPFAPEQTYFKPRFTPITKQPAKNIYGYADGGVTSSAGYSYEYDPLNQLFKKIESMPSDNQPKSPAAPLPVGGGGVNPNQARINAYFDGMSPAQKAEHSQNQANFINAVMPGAAVVKALKSMTDGGESSNISPMAVPSLAMSKVGDAALTGIGMVANKFAKPNPNPDAVQVMDMSTLSDAAKAESALADAQAKAAEANAAQQSQAISAALAGLQGVGGGGMSVGFGTPGAMSGNAGAMGFGPAGMAGQTAASTTSPSAAAAALHGARGGGGGGGGVSTGSGSGGGAAAMGTGAHGMAAGSGSAAGAARGGLMAAYASGGSHLGDYSDGGRLLRGPGDGVSDSIPAMIGKKQPARLADGEFVVPARIVSELGNGSTEAGARKLYAMMDRVQRARRKTVGKGKVAKNSRAERFLPA
jgi:hypothetical protein